MDSVVHHLDELGATASADAEDPAALRATLSQLQARIDILDQENRLLVEQLRLLRMRKFGASSEQRHDDSQLAMDLLGELAEQTSPGLSGLYAQEVLDELAKTAATTQAVQGYTRGKPGRRPLNPNLERVVKRIELPEADRICPHDGAPLKEIGAEVSERAHIIPAQFKVLRTERVKYACPHCDQGLKVAPAPVQLIPRSVLTDESLAWVVTAKYDDGMPLFRIAKSVERFGGELAANTLATLMVRVGGAVLPIINLLRDDLFDRGILHGDETELQVLKEPGRKAQTKSYLWLVSSDVGPPIRLFHYAPGRSHALAAPLYEGVGAGTVLMSDGYEVYDQLAAEHQLVHLGCWAHCRRYVVEAEDLLPKAQRSPPADEAKAADWQPHLATQLRFLIGALFKVEEQAERYDPARDGVDIADAAALQAATLAWRHRLRQQHSRPVLDKIAALVAENLPLYPKRSKMAEALGYLRNQWPKLVRYVENPAWPISNNAAENAIRPLVRGRRAWLFSDSQGGAHTSAALYSLVETCRANGVNTYDYFCALFARLPLCRTLDDYMALLPWAITLPQARPAAEQPTQNRNDDPQHDPPPDDNGIDRSAS
jgi:transposase